MDDPRSAIALLAAQAGLSLGDEDMEALLLALPLVRAAMAALAGLSLGDEDTEALLLALPLVRAVTAALSAPDYAGTEPACRFRAPGPAR